MLMTPGVPGTFLGPNSASNAFGSPWEGSRIGSQGKILLKVLVLPPSGIRGAQMSCVGNCQTLVRRDSSPGLPDELSRHVFIPNCDSRTRRLTPLRYQVHQVTTEFFAAVVRGL